MAVEIKVPSLGESISEGTVSRWLKKDGAAVKANDPLLELETDKATATVSAPASGRLTIAVKEGQTVAVGAALGRIEEGAAEPAEPKERPAAKAKEAAAAPARAKEPTAAPPPVEN